MPDPVPAVTRRQLLSVIGRTISSGQEHEFQSAIFRPVGGMNRIAKAIAAEVATAIRFDAKVTKIAQDDHGVSVTWVDAASGATPWFVEIEVTAVRRR